MAGAHFCRQKVEQLQDLQQLQIVMCQYGWTTTSTIPLIAVGHADIWISRLKSSYQKRRRVFELDKNNEITKKDEKYTFLS